MDGRTDGRTDCGCIDIVTLTNIENIPLKETMFFFLLNQHNCCKYRLEKYEENYIRFLYN